MKLPEKFKLTVHYCPECHTHAVGTRDTIQATAYFEYADEEGDEDAADEVVEYKGESELDWDSQTPNMNEEGAIEVTCDNSHTWFTTIS